MELVPFIIKRARAKLVLNKPMVMVILEQIAMESTLSIRQVFSVAGVSSMCQASIKKTQVLSI